MVLNGEARTSLAHDAYSSSSRSKPGEKADPPAGFANVVWSRFHGRTMQGVRLLRSAGPPPNLHQPELSAR
jgi:hypothetical protein